MMKSEKPVLTPEARLYLRELASLGGKARARKYSKRTLSKWSKRGGRPPKHASRQGKSS